MALVLMISARRGPFRDHLVLFATASDVERLASTCTSGDVFRFRHAAADASWPAALYDASSSTSCVDLRPPVEDLTRGFEATCRYQVRRADKLRDRLEVRGDDPQTVRDFTALYDRFAASHRHASRLRRRRLRRYQEVGNVFVAYLDEEPVVGHVMAVDEESSRARLVFSASTRLDDAGDRAQVGRVNRWLHWWEMRRYRDDGIAHYDFGGVSAESPSARFKLSFGGGLEEGRNLVVAGRAARPALAVLRATSGDFRHRRRAAVRAAE